jgi:hypothetical protein
MTFISIHDVCISKDRHKFCFTYQTARRRHASSPGANWVPGHPLGQSASITTPRKGEQCTERTMVPTSAIARRGPASSLDLERGPPLGASWPGPFEAVFRRFAPHSAAGPRWCNLFRTLRHHLARWGLLVQLPHFRLPPALAGLRLLLRSYPRSSATRNRRPQAPYSHSVSGLSSRNAPCENGPTMHFVIILSIDKF